MLSVISLFALLAPYAALSRHVVYVDPCPTPLRHSVVHKTATRAVLKKNADKYSENSLWYQAFRHPCLQVFFRGERLGIANQYVIYGTCNYEQLFRYDASYVPKYGCWRTGLSIRDQTQMNHCKKTRQEDTIHMAEDKIFSEHGEILEVPNSDAPKFSNYYRYGKYAGNWSYPRNCRCNDSAKFELDKLWRASSCYDDGPLELMIVGVIAVLGIAMFVAKAVMTYYLNGACE